jgi:prevent-host-death family protein
MGEIRRIPTALRGPCRFQQPLASLSHPAGFLGLTSWSNRLVFEDMNVSIYEAKTRFSELIAKVEQGEELVVSRRNRPVARIVPIRDSGQKRIGLLAGRPFRMGEGFDAEISDALGDLFGVAKTEQK